MTDEKFLFVTDCAEKKAIGKSYYNKVRKGGSVRMPSDNLTKKELQAMNGEVKSYRLNEPMKWAEFRAMPDDIKIAYIEAIRNKYKVPDTEIGKMMVISQRTISGEIGRLGLRMGKNHKREKYDKDAWRRWAFGEVEEPEEIPVVEEPKVEEEPVTPELLFTAKSAVEQTAEHPEEQEPAALISGEIEFVGCADAILQTIKTLLNNGRFRFTARWETVEVGEDK